MGVHDWTQVAAGIFHDFHHSWLQTLAEALNRGALPSDYYALKEQITGPFGPDVLALQEALPTAAEPHVPSFSNDPQGGLLLAAPPLVPTAEASTEYHRRQKDVVIRHVTGDRIVAVIEIVSPGNKASQRAVRSFRDKAAMLLDRGIHLVVVELFPPGPFDPEGLHREVWGEVAESGYMTPPDKPLAVAAYECDQPMRTYVVNLAVGEELPTMPLFLAPQQTVATPLPATYEAAFQALPARWRKEFEPPPRSD